MPISQDRHDAIISQIVTLESKVDDRFDKLEKVLKGDDEKPGLYEKVRGLMSFKKTSIKVLWGLIAGVGYLLQELIRDKLKGF